MSEAYYYIQANVACFFIIGLLLLKINHGIDRQTSTIVLRRLILVLMGYFLFDAIWAAVDSGIVPRSHRLQYVTTIIPYALIVGSSYFWFIYCEMIQHNKILKTRKARFLSAIPILVAIILIISATFTGIVFSFDADGKIHYGPFYSVLIIVPVGYMAFASVKAFYRAFKQEVFLDHDMYIVIGVFPLLPMTCGILQTIFIYTPILCYGATISVLLVYLTAMENLISMDSLTQVNNRNQMNRYLIKKMKSQTPGMSLYLMLIDIDHFRDINEAFGHIEGDKALIRVANAMKDACQAHRNRFFVSRYGGDDFIIICEVEYKGEVNWLSDKIKSNVKHLNDKAGVPYTLSVCAGIAEYDYQNPVPVVSLIARADSDLYHVKHSSVG